MILELLEMKQFLQVEDDMTEHDLVISSLIDSIHKRIERECNCIFLPEGTEIPTDDGKRYFIAEADVLCAIKILVCDLFEERGSGDIPKHVDWMLHPFKEHAVG